MSESCAVKSSSSKRLFDIAFLVGEGGNNSQKLTTNKRCHHDHLIYKVPNQNQPSSKKQKTNNKSGILNKNSSISRSISLQSKTRHLSPEDNNNGAIILPQGLGVETGSSESDPMAFSFAPHPTVAQVSSSISPTGTYSLYENAHALYTPLLYNIYNFPPFFHDIHKPTPLVLSNYPKVDTIFNPAAWPMKSMRGGHGHLIDSVRSFDTETPRITSSSTLLPPSFTPVNFSPVQNVCAKCNIGFRMTSDLVYHMRSHHKGDRTEWVQKQQGREERLRCSVCQESFRERHHLSRHMIAHQDKSNDAQEQPPSL